MSTHYTKNVTVVLFKQPHYFNQSKWINFKLHKTMNIESKLTVLLFRSNAA